MQLAFQSRSLYPVTSDDFIAAIDSIEESLQQLVYLGAPALTAYQQINNALQTIGNLLCLLKNKQLKNLEGRLKYVQLRTGLVHNKLLNASSSFREQVLPVRDLLPVMQLIKQLSEIDGILQSSQQMQPLYNVLRPEIASVTASGIFQYQRWLWWSQFCMQCSLLQQMNNENLSAVLVELNFNKHCFINWLVTKLEVELLTAAMVTQKTSCLAGYMARYNTLPKTDGYFIMQPSVQQVMMKMLKTKLYLFNCTTSSQVTAAQSSNLKISTALSVPQLALLLRLVMDVKIISETNTLRILKNIAAIVSTPKVTTISAESLRVNYYTPDTAARSILKEYLLQMIRLLNNY